MSPENPQQVRDLHASVAPGLRRAQLELHRRRARLAGADGAARRRIARVTLPFRPR